MPALTEWKYRALVPRGARSAERVICPSRFTADDLAERFGVDPEPDPGDTGGAGARPGSAVAAIRSLPAERRRSAPEEEPGPPGACVSGAARRRARAPVGAGRAPTSVQLRSCGGWPSGEPLELPGFVDDAKLDALLRGADALVVPSLYEGFGLVVLEAMVRGCPVVLARAGALPEAGGDAAAYFDPLDAEDLAAAIVRVVGRPQRARAAERSRARAGRAVQLGADGGGDRRGLPGAARVRTGFVILSSDEGGLLEHSLRAALAEGFDEALVIDNASSDETAAIARACGVERLELDRRVPYTEAMNAGLRAHECRRDRDAPGRHVRGAGLPRRVPARARRPAVGSVAPKLLRAAGPAEDPAARTDRRRRHVGRPAAQEQPRRSWAPRRLVSRNRVRCSARTGRPRSTGARRFRIARSAVTRCSTRTCRAGAATPTSPGARGCWAGDSRYEPAAVVHHIRTYSPSTRARMSAVDRRTQFRNRYLMIAKNDSVARPAARRRPAAVLRAAGAWLFAAP